MPVQKNLRTNVEKAKAAGRRVAAKLPQATVEGFCKGREAGNQFVGDLPFNTGLVVGYSFGIAEGIVGLLAEPVNAFVGWIAGAIGCGSQGQHENRGSAEVA